MRLSKKLSGKKYFGYKGLGMAAFCDPFRCRVPAMRLKGSKKSPHPKAFSLRTLFYQTASKFTMSDVYVGEWVRKAAVQAFDHVYGAMLSSRAADGNGQIAAIVRLEGG